MPFAVANTTLLNDALARAIPHFISLAHFAQLLWCYPNSWYYMFPQQNVRVCIFLCKGTRDIVATEIELSCARSVSVHVFRDYCVKVVERFGFHTLCRGMIWYSWGHVADFVNSGAAVLMDVVLFVAGFVWNVNVTMALRGRL